MTYNISPKIQSTGQIPLPFNFRHHFWSRTAVNYDLDLVESGFPLGQSYFSVTADQVLGRDILLCSGILTGPATSIYDYAAWGFCMQYARCFRASPGHLRLVTGIESWDDRKKGLFAESLAIGLAGYALWYHDQVVHIADAGPFIGRAIAGPYSSIPRVSLRNKGLYGINGKYKPDFICLTKQGECVIAEAKGGIGPPSCLSSPFKKGKKQVGNVDPIGIPLRNSNSRLVFGTNLRYEHENVYTGKDTTLKVLDPNQDDEPITLKLNKNELIITAYQSIFRFSDREDLSFLLEASEEAIISEDSVRRLTVQVQGLPIYPIYTNSWLLIGLYMPTALELLASHRDDIADRVSESLTKLWKDQLSFQRKDDHLLLPNGILISSNFAETVSK